MCAALRCGKGAAGMSHAGFLGTPRGKGGEDEPVGKDRKRRSGDPHPDRVSGGERVCPLRYDGRAGRYPGEEGPREGGRDPGPSLGGQGEGGRDQESLRLGGGGPGEGGEGKGAGGPVLLRDAGARAPRGGRSAVHGVETRGT